MMNKSHNWSMWVFWLGILILGFLLVWNNALTTTADLVRNQVGFKSWQPYVWELSSFLSTFLLYFGVYWLANKVPLLSQSWLRNLSLHVMASVVFSLLHVMMMVWMRQIIYVLMDGHYEFGDWFSEWLYEYRKDVITYFTFLLSLYAFQYFFQSKPSSSNETEPEKMQIKNKQGVFWVKYADISTIESGGNYVYIHANGEVLPFRSTMAEVQEKLNSSFLRVHRSYIVNLNHIHKLQKQHADSSELVLSNDKVLPVSKKHRVELLTALAHQSNK